MKILKTIILIITTCVFFSCKKEIQMIASHQDSISFSNAKETVVYGSQCCEINGKSGCECVIVEDNDNCGLPTDCVPDGSYPSYDHLNHVFFSQEQINNRAKNKTKITEPALIQMLRKDGFPIKNGK